MDSTPSTVKLNPKPVNLFYIWYTELCRRSNCTPASVVKPAKPKCQTILDFVGDRLKVEEWNPIVNALRSDTSLHVISIKSRIGNCEFLHDVDTEEKAKRMKRRFGSLWTAYVVQQITKSISTSLKHTEVLTYLELDGIPLFCQYIEPLLESLKKNKTVKHLSFANCSIKDEGCTLLCNYLRHTPNIEVINISGCQLTAESGIHISKLIKYQQINRYCESWHKSLRYSNPEQSAMRGIKRITMNSNADFGDGGFDHILNELEDDLWLKALDLQRCGVTENLGPKIIDIVNYNRSLEIVDLRQNTLLNSSTIERVLELLRDKQQFGYQPEFQWANTTLTLALDSLHGSTLSLGTMIHKTKSAPNNNKNNSRPGSGNCAVRKSRTLENITRSAPRSMISELNIKLQSEIQKRKEVEKKNEELKQKLEEVQSSAMLNKNSNGVKQQLKVVVGAVDKKPKSASKDRRPTNVASRNSTTMVTNGFQAGIVKKEVPKAQNGFQPAIKSMLVNGSKNGFKMVNGTKNGIKKCTSVNGVNGTNGYKNGFSSTILDSACKIFNNMMNQNTLDDNSNKDCEELLDYFLNEECITQETDNLSELSSESQESLCKYMDKLRNIEVKYANEKT